jgi:GDP-L-fucose synthase
LFTALGQAFYKEYKFNSANIVLSNMYGPHDHFDEKKSHALGALIRKIYIAKIENLDTVQIWGTGNPIREWLYVEDGAKALVKSLDLEPNYYFFNVGVNKGITILDMALIIANYLKWEGKFELDLTKPDGALEKRVLGSLTEKYLNWLPETTLEAGIKTTIDWYIENSHS